MQLSMCRWWATSCAYLCACLPTLPVRSTREKMDRRQDGTGHVIRTHLPRHKVDL